MDRPAVVGKLASPNLELTNELLFFKKSIDCPKQVAKNLAADLQCVLEQQAAIAISGTNLAMEVTHWGNSNVISVRN